MGMAYMYVAACVGREMHMKVLRQHTLSAALTLWNLDPDTRLVFAIAFTMRSPVGGARLGGVVILVLTASCRP